MTTRSRRYAVGFSILALLALLLAWLFYDPPLQPEVRARMTHPHPFDASPGNGFFMVAGMGHPQPLTAGQAWVAQLQQHLAQGGRAPWPETPAPADPAGEKGCEAIGQRCFAAPPPTDPALLRRADDYQRFLQQPAYDEFIDALLAGPKSEFKEWENVPYFDGCLPIEVMAERGRETLRHGPMKPMGLTNAHNPTVKPYAVVQLRQDNALGTLYNMVGFQTKLKYGAQAEIFRLIPGLENAEFARLGGLHRNTYINSPTLLDPSLTLKGRPGLRFAGQITGCEGYVESASIGLLAGRFAAAERRGETPSLPPETTAFGALLTHITGGHIVSDDEPGKRSFQPMNVNFGLFPPLEPGTLTKPEGMKRFRGKDKALAKKQATAARALEDCARWLGR